MSLVEDEDDSKGFSEEQVVGTSLGLPAMMLEKEGKRVRVRVRSVETSENYYK